MKTTAFTAERNYRIDNTDQYMKARLSHTVEPEEGETSMEVGVRAHKELNDIFRVVYPYVDEHLNFPVIIQRNEKLWKEHVTKPEFERHYNIKIPIEPPNHSDKELNKGSLEDQINACTKIEGETGLKSFEMLASMNAKLKKVYDNKLIELQNKQP